MTSKTLKSAIWLTMLASAVAFAAGGPPDGKGRKPPSEATNNLSVPAIMVGGVAGTVTCPGPDWSAIVPPTGTPITGYPIDPLAAYFVQKVHTWQAQCRPAAVGEDVYVFAAWGDNLGGDANLRAGSPIRVELVLTDFGGASALGYNVVKLEPNKLDRESAYGTLSPATAETLTAVVYDSRGSLLITGPDGFEEGANPLTPEINATGKVVYGYQLIAPTPGQYTITFTMPSVTVSGCDVGACPVGGNTASLTITVGGGGGGKKGRQ